MKSLVIYTTRSGNTQAVAEAIADALRLHGPAELIRAEEAPSRLPEAELIVIGGPTEGHGMTPPLVRLFDRLVRGSLEGRAAAAFDTRVRWPRFLSGSAAAGVAKCLGAAGTRLVAGPESFIVTTQPQLEPGELARARAWAADVGDAVARPRVVAASRG